ncbi:uncharacterized protein B0H18DRAFT_999648 [Fomitopsis serialis]|uniref:uncharacterized protein n=1 Tax=Fomitopsis serialis TaxID=139415 RepID=UPI00200733AE|nr:uncharacterized protein B0H18DRAFT_999648 [Neoantrodia serialis]KAH9928975.1 hypothetical protein B0H18DRAFT_999648 [Neoantrodia serialis]
MATAATSIVFVIDRASQRTPRELADPLRWTGWLKYTMPPNIADAYMADERLYQHIYNYAEVAQQRSLPSRAQRESDREVAISEQLLWIHRLQHRRPGSTVFVITWTQFRDLVLASNGGDPNHLLHELAKINAGLLIHGGTDLTIDYRTPSGRDTFQSVEEEELYIERLRMLSRCFPVWPPVRELRTAARKLQIMHDLDHIAREITKSPRPHTVLYNGGRTQGDCVYKREGSKNSDRFYRGKLKPKRKIDEDIELTGGRWRWMEQKEIPLLCNTGELRVYVAGSAVQHAVHTIRLPHGGFVSSVLRDCLLPQDMIVNRASGCFARSGGSEAIRTTARELLEWFVLNTVDGLAMQEVAALGLGESSLLQYARVDLGVMRGEDGKLHWFVNQVARGLGAGLFAAKDPNAALQVIDSVLESVLKWRRDWTADPSR